MKKNLLVFLISLFVCILILFLTDILLQKKNIGKPLLYYLSPDISYALRPTQKNTRDQVNFVKINNIGMRSSIDWDKNFVFNKYKILLFGDSVLYGGSYVDNKDTLSDKLCKKLLKVNDKKSECGNFGTNAYGITNITNRIMKETLKIKSDFIIVQLTSGNIRRGKTSISGQPFYTKPIEGYFKAFKEIIFFYYDVIRLKFRYSQDNKLSFEKFDKYYFKNEKKELNENIKKFYEREIKFLHDYLESTNINYLIVYWPSKSEIKTNEISLQRAILRDLAYEYSNNYLMIENIDKHLLKKIYYDNIHLTKFGHQFLADKIYKKIKNNNEK